MNNQLPIIHCPKCGEILSRDAQEMREYRVRCEKCKEDYKVEPKITWEFWQLVKKEKVGEKE